MKIFRSYLLLAAVFIFACSSVQPAADKGTNKAGGFTGNRAAMPEAGTDKGRFSVTTAGNASYQIKIEVPPGIRGVQPGLALHYCSNGQNGLLGVGWSLTGFTKVSRVRKIIAIDGVDGALTYTNEDRFALSGKRLLVMTGENGSDGSVYRTEIDNWNKVTSIGVSGTGPTSFTVRRPNGDLLVYGGTVDSRVLVSGRQTVREWLLSSRTDRNGNTVSITYSTDPLNSGRPGSQAYPVEIAYTSNTTVSPSVAANRFVRFDYKARPDVIRHYKGGAPVMTTLRLSAVNTYLGTDLVSNYRLSYEVSASTGRSRLVRIQRFDSTASDAAGLSPSVFSYQDGGNAFAGSHTWLNGYFTAANGWNRTENPVTMADVNGDGLADIVGFKNGVQVSLASATGYQTPATWIDDFSTRYNWDSTQPRYLADINGDGLADIIGFSTNGVEFAFADAAAKSFVKWQQPFPYFAPNAGWSADAPRYLADVNGDGAVDIVGFNNDVQVALANAQGTFDPPTTWIRGFGVRQGWNGENLMMADVNGDGKSDVVAMNQMAQNVNVALSTGTAFTGNGWNQNYAHFADDNLWGPDTPRMAADVNGDGLDDLIGFGTQVMVGLSNGAGFEKPEVWSADFGAPNWSRETPRMLMDVNADGCADVVGVNDGGVRVALSGQSAFIPGSWNQGSLNGMGLSEGGTAEQTRRLVVDVNADGLMDMIAFTPNTVNVGLTAGAYPDLMVNVRRASLGTTTITYKPLSDPSVYSESAGQGALAKFQRYRPLEQNTALPVYRSRSKLTGRYYVVARSVDANNPSITKDPYSYSVSHFYQDAEVSNFGRGWLGFARSIHTNEAMGRTTAVTYHQTFPLIGRIITREVGCAQNGGSGCSAGDIFHIDTYAYDKTTTATSTTTGLKATMVRTKSLRSDKYQKKAYRHSIGQTFQYDAYGNRTQTARLNLVTRTGADIDPSDNTYVNASFQNDPATWRYGFMVYRKTTRSAEIAGLSSFVPGVDFRLSHLTYDANMNITGRRHWDDGNSLFLARSYTYDAFGNVTSVTLPNGAVTAYTFDQTWHTYRQSRTRKATSTGVSLVSLYGYDARFGKQALRIDPNGNAFTTCYDTFGRRQAKQGPAPARADVSALSDACISPFVTAPAGTAPGRLATLMTYQHGWQGGIPVVTQTKLTGWPEEGHAPATQVTTLFYDGLGRRYKMTTQAEEGGAQNRVLQETRFNAMHKPLDSALPYMTGASEIHRTSHAYDALDREVRSTTPWETATGIEDVPATRTYETTATGENVRLTFAAGTGQEALRTLQRNYFANRRRVVSQSFLDAGKPASDALTTGYGRDPLGRITSVAPPPPNPSTTACYSYDSLGRFLKKSVPSIGSLAFAYGKDGHLASRRQGNGTVSYQYDDLGRPTMIAYPKGLTIRYVYDNTRAPNGLGRLASATVIGQAVPVSRTYTYDAYGKATASTLSLGTPMVTLKGTSQFDPLGRPTLKAMPDGTEISFKYTLDMLSQQQVNGTLKVAYGNFTALGLPQTVTCANGAATAISYTPDFNVKRLSTRIGGSQVFLETYERDPHGFPLSVSGNSFGHASYTKTYRYDSARLGSATDSRLPSASGAFGYDPAGNLLTAPGGVSLKASGYQIAPGSTMDGKPLNAAYDAMGNVTSASAPAMTFVHGYDGRNRLTSAAVDGKAAMARYAYDHQGARVWRKDLAGVQHYYYSSRYRQSVAGTKETHTVLHGGTGPIYQRSAIAGKAAETYLHCDARHSLTFTSDAAGRVRDWLLYTPYGQPVGRSATVPPYGFLGKLYDADTGLHYFRSRYYNARLARFTRPDTRYGDSLYRHDSPNRYAFLLNNPAWGFDPSGHGKPACIIGLGAGTAGVVAGISQTVDGLRQHNALSAWGVGASTTIAGGFGIAGGISACIKYCRSCARRAPQADGDDDGGLEIDDVHDDESDLSSDEASVSESDASRSSESDMNISSGSNTQSDQGSESSSETDSESERADESGSDTESESGTDQTSSADDDVASDTDSDAGSSEFGSDGAPDTASINSAESNAASDSAATSESSFYTASEGEAAGFEASTAVETPVIDAEAMAPEATMPLAETAGVTTDIMATSTAEVSTAVIEADVAAVAEIFTEATAVTEVILDLLPILLL